MAAVATPRTRKPKARLDSTGEEIIATWPWEFGIVRLDQLMVDVYQRPLTSFVEKIEREWTGDLLMAICVSEREPDRKYAVVDGQTRTAAMTRLGMSHAPAQIYRGLSLPEEAQLFSRIMTQRRSMTSASRFRADVVAGDPAAVALNALLVELGLYVDPNATGPTGIRAIAAVEYIYHGTETGRAAKAKQDPDLVRKVFETARGAWPTMPDTAKNERMLKGMGRYHVLHPNADMERLVARLAKLTPAELVRRADMLMRGRGLRGNSPDYLAEAIHSQYSKRA